MFTPISANVIAIGRAVLGFDKMTIRVKYALLDQATTAELVATKLLLEQFHSEQLVAIQTIALQLHIRNHSFIAA